MFENDSEGDGDDGQQPKSANGEYCLFYINIFYLRLPSLLMFSLLMLVIVRMRRRTERILLVTSRNRMTRRMTGENPEDETICCC